MAKKPLVELGVQITMAGRRVFVPLPELGEVIAAGLRSTKAGPGSTETSDVAPRLGFLDPGEGHR